MRPRIMVVRVVVPALVVVLLAGCGPARSVASPGGPAAPPGPATSPTGVNLVDEGYTGRFRADATVLERGSGGPQLCLGAIASSYPPQCGGPAIVGWDWAKVTHEDAAGVRWGGYLVVGRFDGTRFTLTEPAREPGTGGARSGPSEPDFRTRCPAPDGGWVPPDPAKATDDAMQQLTELAAKQPGYSALWLDQNMPADAGPSATLDNDPTRIIVNVTTTGDVAALERTLRTVWGGNLCVGQGRRTEAELQAVQTALEHTPGFLSSGADILDGWVDLEVIRATRQLQEQLDRTHGAGMVRLAGALEPID